jgi:hypothetical protein
MTGHWLGRWLLGTIFVAALWAFTPAPWDLGAVIFCLVFGALFATLIRDFDCWRDRR